jgi:hypothetical protein
VSRKNWGEVCLAHCHFAIAAGLAVGFASVGPGPSCRNCSETARDRERNRVLKVVDFAQHGVLLL